jgi:tetratricopeptide (TPR) repeat protein
MKVGIAFIALVALSAVLSTCAAKTLDEYVNQAERYREAGDLDQAAAVMETATAEYPDSAIAYAYLGLYKGTQAGRTDNFMQAGKLVSESFAMLNKALEIDPENPRAHLYRGIMAVNVPDFFGLLDSGIEDLEFVTAAYRKAPDKVPTELALSAYNLLGDAYLKKRDKDAARQAWDSIIELAPGTPSAEAAQRNIDDLSARATAQPQQVRPDLAGLSTEQLEVEAGSHPGDADVWAALGKAQIDAGDYHQAEASLRKAVGLDSLNAAAYKWLALAMSYSVGGDELYDERIHEDTDWATNIAFETVKNIDRAVALAPDDMEARLIRGIIGVNFPFFVGKLDQGIEDLQMVMQSDVPDSARAEAEYWLGFGYQKKGLSLWTKVIGEDPDQAAARLALRSMRPRIAKFDPSQYPKPLVMVDFVLGFMDDLPPQTAVWVESEDGRFIRTLYVSGFSGHAKEVQVVLPVWASTSKFADADAVTGASIDTGEHIYVWDLKDASGNEVKPGSYVVKVEAHFWPSMKYQMASGTIEVGGVEKRVVVEEGDFVPYLEIRYVP